MDSSFFLTTCAAATSFFALLGTLFFMFYKKFRIREKNETENPTSLSLLPPPFSLPRNWTHNVFPSFHGADVRKSFLSHFLKECRSKGIDPFIDNEITRGEFIGPELQKAIKGSRIAVVLLSKKYASSSWCLDELVEIMKCNEDEGYTVMVIFYEVDPTDVKKQAGEFGKVFKETCKGKTNEVTGRWSQALAKVATIAGYHSSNSENEAKMVEEIVTAISNKLFSSTRSRDLDDFVGIEAHMEKMEQFLDIRPGSDEVRMIGIWGPPGIGKTTIARCVFNQHSSSFDLSVFMSNVKAMYTPPVCSDDSDAKLNLQQKFLSQITNQKEGFKITHLGAVQERLHDKRVLVILDNVDQSVQLEALAKETGWFGHGSRIIITTQDQNLLRAHGINHVYKVGVPPMESVEIFCMYAFKQKTPAPGFQHLAWDATFHAGQLPLGLKVIGSSFRGKSKQQWEDALRTLRRSSLNGQIENVLKFSYDALDEKEKDLFLHLTCFFNNGSIDFLENFLGKKFPDFRQVIDVLVDKSLISINCGIYLHINSLLVQLGKEIVRKKYGSELDIRNPWERRFLVHATDIYEVLSDDTTDSRNVIGLDLTLSKPDDALYITSERAFERMTNLQFLRIRGRLYLPQKLNSISRKLILLDWDEFPMICLPSNFNSTFLVDLRMQRSKLEKLWDDTQLLPNLKWMDLGYSVNLKELPDLSTATNLELLLLNECSNLLELPSSIGNAINLKRLLLEGCTSLVELPSSIGNATNLETLELSECSSLVSLPSSIGKLDKLLNLFLKGCSKLEALPNNINLKSLNRVYLTDCSLLKSFPDISTNISFLDLKGTAIEQVPPSISSWSRLESLHMSYSENLKEFIYTLHSITELYLTNTEIQEIGPWVKDCSRLVELHVRGCTKLVSLPQLPDSLLFLNAENCVSLERLDCSFRNPDICLNFLNCFKLNQEARDLIIKVSNHKHAVIPGGEVPDYFSYRANGGTVTVKLNERPPQEPVYYSLHANGRTITVKFDEPPYKSLFKACFALVKVGDEAGNAEDDLNMSYTITDIQHDLAVPYAWRYLRLPPLPEHLYTIAIEAAVTSSNWLSFELSIGGSMWAIKECGILQLS